jgi:hypothetical protein
MTVSDPDLQDTDSSHYQENSMNAAIENPIVGTRIVFADAQRKFGSDCANAGRILEAQVSEIARDVQRSAGSVSSLEIDLETFEALENARMAASTRADIVTAMDQHRRVVDRAKARLRQAWQDYNGRITAAATRQAQWIPQHDS